MIGVGDDQQAFPCEVLVRSMEQMEEGNGVRPAGDANHHAGRFRHRSFQKPLDLA